MSLMDFIDDFIAGPLDLIDKLEGILSGIRHRDMGRQFAIPRADKGGAHNLASVEEILGRYQIAVYGRGFDSKNMYFLVKNRQAVWAEYILLRSGVTLMTDTVDGRNVGWAARHTGPPPAWKDKKPR